MARGLNKAAIGGSLSLGFDLSMTKAFGVLDYSHRMGKLSAFARGFGGMTKDLDRWRPDIGVIGGIGLEW